MIADVVANDYQAFEMSTPSDAPHVRRSRPG